MNASKIVRSWSLVILMCLAFPLTAYSDSRATFQSSDVHIFGTDTAVAGAGTLLRHRDWVELRVAMSGLDMNSTYSVWWIIFNNPSKCAGGGQGICTASDANPNRDGPGINPVKPGVINAAGFITGDDGTANFRSRLARGKPPSGLCCFGKLRKTEKAEIHIVLQSHYTPEIGHVKEQMTTPGAFCNNAGGECEDQFALVFNPVPK